MKTYAAFTFLFLAVLSVARADLTIVSEIKSADIEDAKMGNMTMKLSGGKVRVDTGPAHVIILPAEKKMMVIVDAQKMVMVRSLKDTAGSSSQGGEPPVIERTGKTETINGFACQQILLKDKKGGVSELWVSASAPDMTEFASSFKTLASVNPNKSDFDWTGVMAQKDLNTYPVRIIRYGADGKEEMRITTLSVSKDPIPASEFVKPEGYMEMPLPDFGGMGGTDVGSDMSPSPSNPMLKMQEMQKKMKNGQPPSQADIQKMQEMARQMQQQGQ